MSNALAIVLAVGLVGAAVLVVRRMQTAPAGSDLCTQLAAVDPKLAAGCALLPVVLPGIKAAAGTVNEGTATVLTKTTNVVSKAPFLGSVLSGGKMPDGWDPYLSKLGYNP